MVSVRVKDIEKFVEDCISSRDFAEKLFYEDALQTETIPDTVKISYNYHGHSEFIVITYKIWFFF